MKEKLIQSMVQVLDAKITTLAASAAAGTHSVHQAAKVAHAEAEHHLSYFMALEGFLSLATLIVSLGATYFLMMRHISHTNLNKESRKNAELDRSIKILEQQIKEAELKKAQIEVKALEQ